MTKPTRLALALLASFSLQTARAASQAEEAKFLAAAKAAFAKHDAAALTALTCWDRVPDKLKEQCQNQYVKDAAMNATEVVLLNFDPKFPDAEWKDKAGVAYRSNLPVTKHLKITFTREGRRYPVGEKDGKLWLLEPAPVK